MDGYNKDKKLMIIEMINANKRVADIVKDTGVSRATIQRIKRELVGSTEQAVRHSDDEKHIVIEMINANKRVADIVKDTGFSRATVQRIKRNIINNGKEEKISEPKKDEKNTKLQENKNDLNTSDVKINIDTLEYMLKQLINYGEYNEVREIVESTLKENITEDIKVRLQILLIKVEKACGNYNESKKMCDELLNNPEVSKNNKQNVKNILIEIAVLQKHYDKAEKIIYDALEDRELSDEQINKLKSQLVKVYTKEGEYGKAEKILNQLVKDENLSSEQKSIYWSQLVTVYTKKGRYLEAESLIDNLLSDKNLTEDSNLILIAQLVSVYMKQYKYIEAIEQCESVCNDDSIAMRKKGVLQSQLVEIYIRQGRIKEAIKLATETLQKSSLYLKTKNYVVNKLKKLSRSINKNEKFENIFIEDYKDILDEDTQSMPVKENSLVEDFKKNDQLRKDLYDGKIELEDLNQITQDNCDTLDGCVLIAEICKYLNLGHLGIQCLTGYKKDRELSETDKKTISVAMNLLKQKNSANKLIKKEWDSVYDIMIIGEHITTQDNEHYCR